MSSMEETIELKISIPEEVYDDFYMQFKVMEGLKPAKIEHFETLNDLLVFYLKKLVRCCDSLYDSESSLTSVFAYLRKIDVPVEDFDDLIEKLDLIRRLSAKRDKNKKN